MGLFSFSVSRMPAGAPAEGEPWKWKRETQWLRKFFRPFCGENPAYQFLAFPFLWHWTTLKWPLRLWLTPEPWEAAPPSAHPSRLLHLTCLVLIPFELLLSTSKMGLVFARTGFSQGWPLGSRLSTHQPWASGTLPALAGIALLRPRRRGRLSRDLPLYLLSHKVWWWASASQWRFRSWTHPWKAGSPASAGEKTAVLASASSLEIKTRYYFPTEIWWDHLKRVFSVTRIVCWESLAAQCSRTPFAISNSCLQKKNWPCEPKRTK